MSENSVFIPSTDGRSATVATSLTCDCGCLGMVNGITLSGAVITDLCRKSRPGDVVGFHINGQRMKARVFAVGTVLPEVFVHPGVDDGTSDREYACDNCME